VSLFEETKPPKPLADRLRPTTLDEVLGQAEAKKILGSCIQQGELPSIVLWGPPGSGKTSMSRLMASLLGFEGRTLNATSASVKDIRAQAAEAREIWTQLERRTLLFIDEIHRLNKGQQDVLLPFVENGTLILAGSTTENPFFSLNQALRSRVQLIRLDALEPDIVREGLRRAAEALDIEVADEAAEWIAQRANGDLRLAYTTLESAALMARSAERPVSLVDVRLCLTQTRVDGDRQGDNHYDLASAYQKSMRGSDDNAAIYYLGRFLASGEDPRFIARRLLVTAAEDVGNADPNALSVATAAFRACEVLGMPECRIPLAQATLYIARAPKSNEAITSLGKVDAHLENNPLPRIPAHLRDAHYKGAETLGHGKGYLYSHNHQSEGQVFLPDEVMDEVFVQPTERSDAPPKNQKQTLTTADTDRLLERLEALAEGQTWFEIPTEDLAQDLSLDTAMLRTTLNRLVQEQRLVFRRMFSINAQKKDVPD